MTTARQSRWILLSRATETVYTDRQDLLTIFTGLSPMTERNAPVNHAVTAAAHGQNGNFHPRGESPGLGPGSP